MPDGGFLVKFDGKEAFRCYFVSFDYDEWFYTVNNNEKHVIPPNVKNISIIREDDPIA